MIISVKLNNKNITKAIEPGLSLYDFLRQENCYSVKCGCETSNCGACTVLVDGEPILSCSMLAARADGREITTLEGLQKEAQELGRFIAGEGADQCGFCNPGYMINAIALLRSNPQPTETEITQQLAGNLCRCSGYQGQVRGIIKYIQWKNSGKEAI